MSKGLSPHAGRALERLMESHVVNGFIRSDAARNDGVYPGCSPVNLEYNDALEFYLGSLQVCHAADTLNSYCQSILSDILATTPGAWNDVRKFFRRQTSSEEMIELLRNYRAPDGEVRPAIRDGLQCYWSPESDVIIRMRNKFVHQNGYDPGRDVDREIRSKNDQWCIIFPVDVTDRKPHLFDTLKAIGLMPTRHSGTGRARTREIISTSWIRICARGSIYRGNGGNLVPWRASLEGAASED